MTNFPSSLDDDNTLPSVYDNITEIGGDAINAQKDAIISIEQTLGVNVQGSADNLAQRLDYLLEPDGSPKLSVMNTIGLVTLPITNAQIDGAAGISESKLDLDYPTNSLNSLIEALDVDINQLQSWISTNGNAIVAHLNGSAYKHSLQDINIGPSASFNLEDVFGNDRGSSDAYETINEINTDFNTHRKRDGSGVSSGNITTLDNELYPDTFAHTAAGIFVDSSQFNAFGDLFNLQELLEFLDNSSLLTFGGRIKNFYSNGISRLSASTKLSSLTEGEELISATPATAFLRQNGLSSIPWDDINTGDDIIKLKPPAGEASSHRFDAKFRAVSIGDIIHVTYTGAIKSFTIKEIKLDTSGPKQYIVRVYGKNIEYNTNCSVRITKKLDNSEKFGVLAVAEGFTNYGSDARGLSVINPKSAMTLGIGFDPNQLDSSHYNLYLAIYPDGYIADINQMYAIDVTGNQGTTSGAYNLEKIVFETNKAFRKIGVNMRFTAFSHKGEFGIALDPIGGESFSIIMGVRGTNGQYNHSSSAAQFPNNVFQTDTLQDGLGFGPLGSGVASPVYNPVYSDATSARLYTKIISPLRKNNYYVNGNELDNLARDFDQVVDANGDGYWIAKVQDQLFSGGRAGTTYRIEKNLSTSSLAIGKSIIVQKKSAGTDLSFGRFVISGISYYDCGCDELIYTDISVVDAVHDNNGVSGSPSYTGVTIDDEVLIYFNNDSVSFNLENANDIDPLANCYRWFEVFIDDQGRTFSHERGRIFADQQTIQGVDTPGFDPVNDFIVTNISPKLKGYNYGEIYYKHFYLSVDSTIGMVTAFFEDNVTGISGPITRGKVNSKIKIFDESANDFIEIFVPFSTTTFNGEYSIQLFPSMQGNTSFAPLAGVWVPLFTSNPTLQITKDLRQFGNVGVKDLSTESLNYIASVNAASQSNGVINGFGIAGRPTQEEMQAGDYNTFSGAPYVNENFIDILGGQVIVNGKVVLKNREKVWIPRVTDEAGFGTIGLFLAIDEVGNYKFFLNNSGTQKQVYNIDSTSLYSIDNATLSEIRYNKKYTPLYFVISFTGGDPENDLEYYALDIRKYSLSSNDMEGATANASHENCNFLTFQAMINYLSLDNNYSTKAYIKGTQYYMASSAVVSYDFGNFSNNNIEIIGDGSDLIVTTAIGADATLPIGFDFKNLNLSMTNSSIRSTALVTSPNTSFDNVLFKNFSSAVDATYPNVAIKINTGNVKFNKCTFNFTSLGTVAYAFNPVFRATVITVNDIDDYLDFNECIFQMPSSDLINNQSSTAVLITGSNASSIVNFDKCTFTGHYGKAIAFSHLTNNVKIENCSFISEIDYSTNSLWTDDPSDNLKAFEGVIYIYDESLSAISRTKQNNIKINNNVFKTTGQLQTVPSILIEANRQVNNTNDGFFGSGKLNYALIMSNFEIKNNTFVDSVYMTSAMVAITNKSTSIESGYYFNPTSSVGFPFLIENLNISGNVSYNNVSSIISDNTDPQQTRSRSIIITQSLPYKAFSVKSCRIEKNTCSRIAYFGFSVRQDAAYPGPESATPPAWEINDNYCNLIHQADLKGADYPLLSNTPSENYFPAPYAQMHNYVASANIYNNSMNWLSIGTSNSYINTTIRNNEFNAYDVSMLNNFQANSKTFKYTTNNYPIKVVSSDVGGSYYNQYINVIGNKIKSDSFNEYFGYTNITSGANIIDNTFAGVGFGVTVFVFYFRAGTFTNNTVYLNNTTGSVFANDAVVKSQVVYANNIFLNGDSTNFTSTGLFGDVDHIITSNNVGQRNFEIISLHEMKPIKRHTLPAVADYNVMNMYYDTSPGGSSRSLYSYLSFDDSGAILAGQYEAIINLSNRIPDGSRITKITLGGVLRNSTNTANSIDVSSTIDMQLYYPTKSPTDLTSFYDVGANLSPTVDSTLTADNYTSASMSIADLNTRKNTTTTTYATLTGSNLYVSNHLKTKVAYLKVRIIVRCAAGAIAEAAFSPIVVEYVQGYQP